MLGPTKPLTHRRPKIVSYLVSQSELRNLRRNSRVVIDKGDDSSVEAPLGRMVDTVNVLSVSLKCLADPP